MNMKSRKKAFWLAFILGGFGAHKFYLGKTTQGILYLVFCWTYVPAFIALVESIIYITMSDQDFQQKYCGGAVYQQQQMYQQQYQQQYQQPYQPQPMQQPYQQQVPQQPMPQQQFIAQGQAMFCPSCGAKIDAGTKFCPSCGNQIV